MVTIKDKTGFICELPPNRKDLVGLRGPIYCVFTHGLLASAYLLGTRPLAPDTALPTLKNQHRLPRSSLELKSLNLCIKSFLMWDLSATIS